MFWHSKHLHARFAVYNHQKVLTVGFGMLSTSMHVLLYIAIRKCLGYICFGILSTSMHVLLYIAIGRCLGYVLAS